MRGLLNFIIVAFVALSANLAMSATHYGAVQWRSPVIPHAPVAANCFSIIPDERPMAVPRTLVVDNNLPDGSEVYSWGYGTFSDVVLGCTSTGNPGMSTAVTLAARNTFTVTGINDSFGGARLSDRGLRLKVWVNPITSSTPCTGASSCANNIYDLSSGNTYPSLAAGSEIETTANWGLSLTQRIDAYIYGGSRYYPTISGRYAIRAAIIKVGNLDYNGPLKAASPPK